MQIAGIMTGTSVDAIDVALCTIRNEGHRESVSLDAFIHHPFGEDTYGHIQEALAGRSSLQDLCEIPYLLARDYAAALRRLPVTPEAVAVHGQTLWHAPPHGTWQAISGPALAALTGTPVVFDFRSADVALGGQGAPLVPLFDLITLASPEEPVVALNIGGMANVTMLPVGVTEATVVAFDTGPGNVWIDQAVRNTFGKRFDNSGNIARAGAVIRPMFEECIAAEFFREPPPKSTGREVFSTARADSLIRKYSHPSAPLEDVVSTFTEVTAWSIAQHVATYAPRGSHVIVSGGGSQNTFLLERLANHLRELETDARVSVHPSWQEKEAMAFAYLGWRTLRGLPGNLPSVTGAQRSVVLGAVARA